ncbi:acetyltransferase [Vibrio cholerae]|nr:acetyltransferase [Vibrio cholerae]
MLCLSLVVMRCQPLRRALGAMSENLMIITWLHLKVTLLDLILSVDSMDAIYE